MKSETVWLIVGFTGQFLFSLRFLVQWLKSESQKKSVVPIEFWFLSLAGGATLSAYALYKHDPVFIVGQLSGLLVYTRNLQLILKERKRNRGGVPPAVAP